MPGIFLVACSIGTVIKRSISGAPALGADVIIITWLLVMSGTASIGNLEME